MKDIKTIGVIGYKGMVGSAVYKYFKTKMPTFGYSNSDRKDKDLVNDADLIFICVPTPYRWTETLEHHIGYDDSIVDDVLKKITDGSIVVIKSTIHIGSTNKFQVKYPKLKLLFNPEFLSEASAYGDFINPDRQFVGYTKESYPESIQVLNLLPESAYDLICPAKEAELLKYINNLHGILEVMESNHYYDVCEKEGLDYDRVSKAMIASKWVGCAMGRHYRKIWHKGYRGVGGACFPKDLNSWLEFCKSKNIEVDLFEAVRHMNRNILASQGLTEELSEKISSSEDIKKLQKKE